MHFFSNNNIQMLESYPTAKMLSLPLISYLPKWGLNLNSSTFVGFHVDDSEVTLNVCLGKEFSGGELFFRGTRCDKHVNTGSQSEVCQYLRCHCLS